MNHGSRHHGCGRLRRHRAAEPADSIDRDKAARYGLQPLDINNVVQAAVGGAPVTQIIEGDRRFDFTVRYSPQFRSTPEDISRILLPTPDGNQVQLGESPT